MKVPDRYPTGRTLRMLTAAIFCMVIALSEAHAARIALLIGNDNYRALTPLQNAAKDARDMAVELRKTGFEVPEKWVVQNGTRRQMDAALQDFLARIGPGDEVVFFFSGHGVQIGSTAALVPVDISDPARRPLDGSTRPLSEVALAEQQVLDESITLNRVAADIASRNAKFSLLVVDACRDNPIIDLLREANAGKSSGPAPTVGLIADAAADTQVLLFSASKGQQSLDRLGRNDPVKNGVFTRVLLDAIRTPGLGLRDLIPQVKSEVRRLAATQRDRSGRPHVQEPRSMASYDAPNFFFHSQQTSAQSGGRTLEVIPVIPLTPSHIPPLREPRVPPAISLVGRWVGAADCTRGRYPIILNIMSAAGSEYTLELVSHLNLKQNMQGSMVSLPGEGRNAAARYVVQFQDDRGIPIKNGQRFEPGERGELRAEGGAGRCAVVLWSSSADQAGSNKSTLPNLAGSWAAELQCPRGPSLARVRAVRVSASEYKLEYSDSLNTQIDEGRFLLHESLGINGKFVFWHLDDRFTMMKNGQWLTPSGATLDLEAADTNRQCKGTFYRQ